MVIYHEWIQWDLPTESSPISVTRKEPVPRCSKESVRNGYYTLRHTRSWTSKGETLNTPGFSRKSEAKNWKILDRRKKGRTLRIHVELLGWS